MRVSAAAALIALPARAATLQPHSAVYEVRLARAGAASRIEDARGAVRIDWRESCTDWTTEQRFQLALAIAGGASSVSNTEFRSVETKDWRRYEFSSLTLRDGAVAENFKGVVERAGPDAAATVRYQEPAGVNLPLPSGVMLPMQHMVELLRLAERGGGQLDVPYFDGPRPEDTPFEAAAVVASRPRPPADSAAKLTAAPFDRPWWPVRIAFFARGARTAEPDFEIGAEIQDNGVARMLVFDYGDFAVTATAVAGEKLAQPRC